MEGRMGGGGEGEKEGRKESRKAGRKEGRSSLWAEMIKAGFLEEVDLSWPLEEKGPETEENG